MSDGAVPRDSNVQQQSLDVQELFVSGQDGELYSTAVGTPLITSNPYLGVAGNYALLAASSITNTGSSVITGNVGLNPGTSITPGGWTVSGRIDVDNANAMAAQAAALAGYNTMVAMVGAATPINHLLDGQTLTPGAYKEASSTFSLAASGNGTLTLNGAGNYFIIASSSITFGAGGTPSIVLTGGALASQVYFIVPVSATLNVSASGTLNGNFLAGTSITVDGGTVNGSLLSSILTSGSVTISAATNVSAVSGQVSTPTINLYILIDEPINKIYFGQVKVDSTNHFYEFNNANMAIVDSNLLTPGGNMSAIALNGLVPNSFNPNDVAIVKYSVNY